MGLAWSSRSEPPHPLGARLDRWERKEGEPLYTADAYVGGHKIALGADVHLVAHLVIVRCTDDGPPREDGISTVVTALPSYEIRTALLNRLSVHLRPYRRPDPIGPN